MKKYKIGEGKELVGIIDLFENMPWWIRWNPMARLLGTFYEYRRYIELIDEKGNVEKIYEGIKK